MQQWNFSFFLFSAKRGGTSPNVQGRLSCWFDQLENIAFRLNISSFHKIPWRMHHQIDGNLLMRVRMAPWCDPCASVSPHGSLSCGWCARSHVVIIYTWRGATKMATKDIDCPTINHHYKGVMSFFSNSFSDTSQLRKPRMVSISLGGTLHNQIEC